MAFYTGGAEQRGARASSAGEAEPGDGGSAGLGRRSAPNRLLCANLCH